MDNDEKEKSGVSVFTTISLIIITALIVYILTSYWVQSKVVNNTEYIETLFDAEPTTGEFKKLNRVMGIVERDFLKDYDVKKLEEGAIRGLLDALGDPYTSYFDKSETESFLLETEGDYEGVGLYVSYDKELETVIVLMPIENSPAKEADIRTGDYILEVDDVSVVGVSLEEVATRLKGEAGSIVKIKILRKHESGEDEELIKELSRRKIELTSFEYKVLENDIAYITFASFDENVTQKFNEAYKQLTGNKQIKGLILDLRNNPGGLLNVATDVADKLLPTGKIVYTIDKNGKEEVINSDSKCIDIPIVVLVNENSASASEIMAAAIKDYGGKVIGKTTYGKGLVQEFKNLLDGTYVKITISEYFSPKGNKIDKIGVTPDIEIADDVETVKDEQLEAALNEIRNMIK